MRNEGLSEMAEVEHGESPRVLYGVPAVAKYLGIGERQARHQIDKGCIPSFKIGGRICARPADLDAWLEKLSGGDAA